MKPAPEQTADYIQALEAVNKQLVISLKRCLELLANVMWGKIDGTSIH